MGELIVGILQVVGLFAGKWLLPRVSGGLLVVMPSDTTVGSFRLAPYVRLPNGKIGVDGHLVGSLLALLFLVATIGLCCVFFNWLA